MKSFAISQDQLVGIVAALTADELARSFGRYTETLTLCGWNAETALGKGGVGTDADQLIRCAARAAQFFDLDEDQLVPGSNDTFGTWAGHLEGPIRERLSHFRFQPATPAGHVDSRHNADDIYQDAGAVASLMQGRRRVVSLVSPHSLIGLVSSVLAPNLLGLDIVDARGLDPDTLSERVAFGDLIIATPTLWRYLADMLPGLATNVMGLSFGERLAPDLLIKLRQRGLGAMRELYGSTETGVIGWRDSPPDPFVLFDHWSADQGAIIRQRPSGQRVKMIAMDDLLWQGARSFVLGTRRDGAVQIGAVNVFPGAIASIIEEHPDVSSCAVRVSQRAGALDRLIADVTLKPARPSDQGMAWSIDQWCRERLRPPERPRIIVFFETLAEDDETDRPDA